MKNEFALAFNEVLEEKQLPKEIILSAIESAMVSAYRRSVNASNAQEVEARVDPETGNVAIFAEKEVVEDVQDERTEVLLEEARKVDPEAVLGDMVIVETTPSDFGRVAAQTARQVIQQRIREAERSAQMEYFQRQVGEIVSGIVQATSGQGVTIGLDMKAEGLMPNNQKIGGERFRIHDRVRSVVLEVKDGSRGPQIILSRAHRNFLRRLLENEVPEIYHGIVEIRAIAREPGQRAKVAVFATQPGVDPVGACVGIKGVRIQAIVKELHDEKIDIIEWSADPVVYISKAISPARVTGVYLTETMDGNKTATVVVTEDQLSLAIGRDGQNARLAAKLTGWRIDIKSLAEATADSLATLQSDAELAELLPVAVESIPAIDGIVARKTEGRPISPEEYQQMAQFVDRVERRTIQIQEDAQKAENERAAAARADIPPAAFETDLEGLGLKEHVYTILSETEMETVGDLMLKMTLDPDRVLGLPGIGPKAMQNIEECLEAITFPEPEPEPEVEAGATVETVPVEEEVTEVVAEEAEPVVEALEETLQVEAGLAQEALGLETKDAEITGEEKEAPEIDEEASLEDIFVVRPDMFQTPVGEVEELADDDDASSDKGKKSKKKKKSVVLEFDEEVGRVVSRKKHKHEDEGWEEHW
ncbi:MAG: transcription termination/antitermination protein NusA [Anaerolineales bacterium]|nr:transcription termination/antitermination protein NusA [Anaerolineales bacterium]